MELYLDNYKGFVDTLIPIKDVTFFVGENSTGKTSILKLLDVLNQSHFWFNPSFNNTEIELGYFSEIVNQLSEKKDSFSIGVCFDDEKKKSLDNYIWMLFKEKNSTPILSGYKFVIGRKSVWCETSKRGNAFCRSKDVEEDITFDSWVRDFNDFSEEIDLPQEIVSGTPFFITKSIVENILFGDGREKGSQINLNYVIPRLKNNFYWIAPIRAKAQRWYESFKLDYSAEGEHIPVLLKRVYDNKTSRNKKIVEELENFGKCSGLYDKLEVKKGRSGDAPFSLRTLYGQVSMNITNVGYGVSQILPPIVELLTSKNSMFAIQQPEVHLHPKAQAAFGELLFSVSTKNKNKIIVETHSDYIINRFRYSISRSKAKLASQVLLFERDEKGTHVKQIPINTKGAFEGDAVGDYMKFFFDEEMKMLEM